VENTNTMTPMSPLLSNQTRRLVVETVDVATSVLM
jgi:hypothetical protein